MFSKKSAAPAETLTLVDAPAPLAAPARVGLVAEHRAALDAATSAQASTRDRLRTARQRLDELSQVQPLPDDLDDALARETERAAALAACSMVVRRLEAQERHETQMLEQATERLRIMQQERRDWAATVDRLAAWNGIWEPQRERLMALADAGQALAAEMRQIDPVAASSISEALRPVVAMVSGILARQDELERARTGLARYDGGVL